MSKTLKGILGAVLILGMFTIAPSYASRSTDFAAPPDTSGLRSLGYLIHRHGWVIDHLYLNTKPS